MPISYLPTSQCRCPLATARQAAGQQPCLLLPITPTNSPPPPPPTKTLVSCRRRPPWTWPANALCAASPSAAGRLSAALLRIVASRLPVKDAERVIALFPRWRRAWRSVPLVLDDTHLVIAGVHETVPAVDHLLTAHPGPFRTVRLTFSFFGDLDGEDELARWPRLLAAKGVQELFFINPPPPIDMRLPADILRCTELRRLYLGFWEFPDTRCLTDGAGVFPHLREFVLLNTRIEDRDLDHMLTSSPALETLALVLSYGLPQHVRLRGQNLRCALFWLSMADELAVVDAPRLERLLMWLTTTPCVLGDSDSDDEPPIRVRIACAPELKVLGYLDTRIHQLQIGNTIIKVLCYDVIFSRMITQRLAVCLYMCLIHELYCRLTRRRAQAS
ncbi:F-box/LRR-repeat protein 13 [Setaria viridis]|uniref:F-box/LRR-repeat protein 13 n=1 Tax=Setaria viridis TaxID=4556 RepID=UPI003B3A86BF